MLSLCLIAKNEEQRLAACLESASEVADEIVVVDTGSKDATVAIARRYGAKVYEFPWRDDFAAAKNETLKYATGEWVLALDADERLDVANRRRVRQLIEMPDYQAYLVQLRSPYPAGASGTRINTALSIRLFRNNIGLRYYGRLHESISPRGLAIAATNVTVVHDGYKDNLQQKYERNLSLLRQQNTASGVFSRFDMARSCAGIGLRQEAMRELEVGLMEPGAGAWLRAQMYLLLGDLLDSAAGDAGAALRAWHHAAELDTRIVAPGLRLGRAYYSRGEYDRAAEQFERVVALLSVGSIRGARLDDEVTPAEARVCLATCHIKSGHRHAALDVLAESAVGSHEDETLKVVPWHPEDTHGDAIGPAVTGAGAAAKGLA